MSFRKTLPCVLLITLLAACGGGSSNQNSSASTEPSSSAGAMSASGAMIAASRPQAPIPSSLKCGAVQPVWTNPRSHTYFESTRPSTAGRRAAATCAHRRRWRRATIRRPAGTTMAAAWRAPLRPPPQPSSAERPNLEDGFSRSEAREKRNGGTPHHACRYLHAAFPLWYSVRASTYLHS